VELAIGMLKEREISTHENPLKRTSPLGDDVDLLRYHRLASMISKQVDNTCFDHKARGVELKASISG